VAGGSSAGGSTAGGSTAGGSTAGGSTAGGSTAGGSTAGGAVAGGATAGGTAQTPGDTCASPIAIADAGVVMGTTATALADYSPSTAGECSRGDAREVVYQVSIPAMTRLVVTATPLSNAFDIVLNLAADASACTSPNGFQCLAGVDTGTPGRTETLTFSNTGASRSALLVVDGWDAQDFGSFMLNVSFQPIAVGDTCEGPAVLTPGTPLTAQALSGFSDDYEYVGTRLCRFRGGSDRVYSVLVPTGQRLTAVLSPSGFDGSLSIIRGAASCAAELCTGGVDQGFTNDAETLQWDNLYGTDETVLLVVDSAAGASGAFSLSATLVAAPTGILGGSSCSAPVQLDAGTYVSSTAGSASRYDFSAGGGCVSSSTAPDTVFSVSIPANSMLRATVTPNGWDAILNAFSSAAACGLTIDAGTLGATCLASSDGPQSSSVERVTLRNPGATATTALLVIDGHTESNAGSFTISTEVVPFSAMSGDLCSAPQVLSMSGSLTGLTTDSYVNDVETASSCTGYQNRGSDRVFSISVPAGRQLTAVVIPSGWDAAIYIIDPSQCGMNATCLDGNDTSTTGAETARFTNTGTAARDVLIVVDSYSASPGGSGAFDLFTSLTP
jgi:hypothetical protein